MRHPEGKGGGINSHHEELVLSNTVTDDSGIYQCVANNSIGMVWAAGRLLVNASRDQPSPPINPHCLALSASRVHISWDQPADTDIKAYTVHYLPTGKSLYLFILFMVLIRSILMYLLMSSFTVEVIL